eukprot:379054-Amphidinium_carterae.1
MRAVLAEVARVWIRSGFLIWGKLSSEPFNSRLRLLKIMTSYCIKQHCCGDLSDFLQSLSAEPQRYGDGFLQILLQSVGCALPSNRPGLLSLD